MGRKKGYVEFDDNPPDDFDPANPYKDPVAMLEMREHIVREKWIQIEKAKIIREKLRWCYRIEGINHHQKCRHLVKQYLESTRGIGWGKDGRHPSLHGWWCQHQIGFQLQIWSYKIQTRRCSETTRWFSGGGQKVWMGFAWFCSCANKKE
ncbi:NADH dehydrogenase [ubiquinone] 1 beta subcomplex subunit 10-B isoform X1 [Medicago truncatula]|uniref:NADH dehydrogenase [ubiquinone] 1 beta subcomplex subunit 10-B isoform X1 n=1 Tax=Medicago truncatula TaxID=3880 RepID=UPI000D2F2916|nr:NADH dehydrogenase [ubiquinone] 1 beta subcomplex subunit 10-B isoform X1 [Medicago truncatula]